MGGDENNILTQVSETMLHSFKFQETNAFEIQGGLLIEQNVNFRNVSATSKMDKYLGSFGP